MKLPTAARLIFVDETQGLRYKPDFHVSREDDEWNSLGNKGVFLVKMKNAFVPVKRVYSMNTYS